MSFSTLWDRFFWSFMLLVFTGIVWLIVFDDSVRYFPWGLVLGLVVGGTYLLIGIRRMRAQDRALRRSIEDAELTARAARETGAPHA